MSIGSRVIIDFVFELTWADIWAGQYLIKTSWGWAESSSVELRSNQKGSVKLGLCLIKFGLSVIKMI